jgi:hypothetical protein
MLLCPALLAGSMVRATALKQQHEEGPSFAPGIMTGEAEEIFVGKVE